MPRVNRQKASQLRWSKRDKRLPEGVSIGDLKPNRTCNNCSSEIKPGETYLSWEFRYGGGRIRCSRPECAPKRSDLTQSKMGEVYDAIETAEADIVSMETYDDVEAALSEVAESVRGVASEYQEAAEAFGGQGENQERYEALESFADSLESGLSTSQDWDRCQSHQDCLDDEPKDGCEECTDSRENWLDELREEAQDLLSDCPY